jgi:hypothetical protein
MTNRAIRQAAFNEDDDAPPAISLEAHNKLARWRSKLNQTPKLNKRDVFEKAADDLFLEAEFERDLGAVQAIGDAIYVLGRDHTGLDDDSIQFVMVGAKGRIEQLNGNSKHSDEVPPAMSPEEYGQRRNKRTQSEPISLRYFSDLKEATPKLWLIKNVIAAAKLQVGLGRPVPASPRSWATYAFMGQAVRIGAATASKNNSGLCTSRSNVAISLCAA